MSDARRVRPSLSAAAKHATSNDARSLRASTIAVALTELEVDIVVAVAVAATVGVVSTAVAPWSTAAAAAVATSASAWHRTAMVSDTRAPNLPLRRAKEARIAVVAGTEAATT
jgi:hypothetical protein